jgi:hypothetical protein
MKSFYFSARDALLSITYAIRNSLRDLTYERNVELPSDTVVNNYDYYGRHNSVSPSVREMTKARAWSDR